MRMKSVSRFKNASGEDAFPIHGNITAKTCRFTFPLSKVLCYLNRTTGFIDFGAPKQWVICHRKKRAWKMYTLLLNSSCFHLFIPIGERLYSLWVQSVHMHACLEWNILRLDSWKNNSKTLAEESNPNADRDTSISSHLLFDLVIVQEYKWWHVPRFVLANVYRFCSFHVLPSKNSFIMWSRSSGEYLMYFWGFFPFSIIGL